MFRTVAIIWLIADCATELATRNRKAIRFGNRHQNTELVEGERGSVRLLMTLSGLLERLLLSNSFNISAMPEQPAHGPLNSPPASVSMTSEASVMWRGRVTAKRTASTTSRLVARLPFGRSGTRFHSGSSGPMSSR